MSATATHRIELPEGYTVVDRLGAGGYGEVWKAIAPGGLEKAVKIVFGHCDEGMAERELKSLERIKSVRHPFLLSIERYEIVGNRLVIVTELADMSLSDCFQNHVASGRTGIPREELITYLWDAAEALDCLLEHHSLQHLDIKPENLLVVGDHVKVADFGLVKELASKTLNSVMGGMTPLYSAPEIYDNNPSPRSDQYSLAIVYQHMLTGQLPFSGRTPAQLAKQHTLAQPNVNPLMSADRVIVKKALEKNPQSRFASCREFVSALRSASQVTSVRVSASEPTTNTPAPKSISSDDTKSISLIETKHLRDPVCAAATQVLAEIESVCDDIATSLPSELPTRQPTPEFPLVDGVIVDVESPAFDQSVAAKPVPTLFVGIGGIGIKLLKTIRDSSSNHNPRNQLVFACLGIDTERETLKAKHDDESSLSTDDKLHIPLRRPHQYRDESQALLQWVSRRWLYNIPRSLQTRGFRPLGRIAIVDHASEVLSSLQKRLLWLAARNQEPDGARSALRVVVLAGMSGGTGSGTVIDVAQAVRSICLDHSLEVIVQGVLGCTYHHESNDSLAAANMYALLTELGHAQCEGNNGDSTPPGHASRYESPQPPFDEIYTVQIPLRGGYSGHDPVLQSVADYLLLDASGTIHPAVDAIRSATLNEFGRSHLRTFSCVDFGLLAGQCSAQFQQRLLKDFVDYWLRQGSEINDPDARFFQSEANSQFARAVLAHFPKIADALGASANEANNEERRSRRAVKIKRLADGFLQFLDVVKPRIDNDESSLDHPHVGEACGRIITNLCKLLEYGNPTDNELVQLMFELVGDQLTELTVASKGSDKSALVGTALAVSSIGPLNCGFQRRTILVTPQEEGDPELMRALRDKCSTVSHYPTKTNQTYLIREGSHLNPLHLGARLAEIYPDIAEAAGRLHSRDDIKWHDLRFQPL